MLDTITSSERPTAASHAANTKSTIGSMFANVKCVVKIVIAPKVKSDNIIPSKHSSDDIRCARYIRSPNIETENARAVFI